MEKDKNKTIVVDSVWKKKHVCDREVFLREALVEFAHVGLAPELFFDEYKLTEFKNTFVVMTAALDIKYSFENGTPLSVGGAPYIDWNTVEFEDHVVIHTAINRDWDGESVGEHTYYTDKRLYNRMAEEGDITQNYIYGMKASSQNDDFPAEKMWGEYEKVSSEPFELSQTATDRILEKCFIQACSEFRLAKYKKNLRYNVHYEILHTHAIVVPRYKLSYYYNNEEFPIISSMWHESAIIEKYPPDWYKADSDYEKSVLNKMNEQIMIAHNASKDNQHKDTFFTKLLNKLFGDSESNKDANIVRVKIQISTSKGLRDMVITSEKYNFTENTYYGNKKEMLANLRVIALALTLSNLNMSPMTEDEYHAVTGCRAFVD